MQRRTRRNSVILGLVALGLLAGGALTASPAHAVDAVGPYYAVPSWDQKKAVANRFVVLTNWNSAAVLDKETGLVWERSPAYFANGIDWYGSRSHCIDVPIGGRKGWRLPAIAELASLIDPTVAAPGPTLPPGHPFTTAGPYAYWSATTFADNQTTAWFEFFDSGHAALSNKSVGGIFQVWCVRGGMNADAY